MKILTVIGARPQFIKAAAVSREIAQTQRVVEYIVHTGQHYDQNMSGIFFQELDIPKPNINLGIGSGLHGEQTAQMLTGIEREIIEQKPSSVLVYGDTNSTIAATLAATKLNVPVCHVEAGLRSFNKRMPEEINRILTDHASDLLFAPTESAVSQLRKEGIPDNKVVYSGDVMYDTTLYYQKIARKYSTIINQLSLKNSNYILATIHRAENTDDPVRLTRIINELESLTAQYRVIFPLHPRTKKTIKNLDFKTDNIEFINPTGFLDMIALEQHATAIITDSGGVQKEAFFHKKPCITLREETEWLELVNSGWNRLFPPYTYKSSIIEQLRFRTDTKISCTSFQTILRKWKCCENHC